jgi:hypothetical protein
MNIEDLNWSKWKPFPDPSKSSEKFISLMMKKVRNLLYPGLYQLKNIKTNEYVLFGIAKEISKRMSSLIPNRCGGVGTRNNQMKREYVWNNIDVIEFRTITTETRQDAQQIERYVKSLNIHIFNT